MNLSYNLTIEQAQKLTMTPELIQAIHILQYNSQELEEYVQDELIQNPLLEFDSFQETPEAEEEKATEVEAPAAEVKAEAPQAEEKKSGSGTGLFMGIGIIVLGVLIASLCGVPIPYL